MLKNRKAICIALLAALSGIFSLSLPADAGTGGASSEMQAGIDLYGQGRWGEAAGALRPLTGRGSPGGVRSEALFWLSLSELAMGDYEGALRDMEELERSDPANRRVGELGYYKGRTLFSLGNYDEAIIVLKNYADSIPGAPETLSPQDSAMKSAALYWVGECLYSMGLLDRAGEMFLLLTESYPQSAKYEAASYRLALINQKRVEAELLSLLKWSHEESLKTLEEYERRERSYDQALIAYQKRIADMLKDTRLADLELSNARYREQLAAAEERIRILEETLRQNQGSSPPPSSPTGRLRTLKSEAEEIRDQLIKETNR
ncbi:MAG: tetratricopeptide repeat protein [Treponema sp.]|jgi:TolA-binding protein|nr:tetratricopeptide repeat protein [Treponema sp.]